MRFTLKPFGCFFIFIVWAALVPPAQSQWICKVVEEPTIGTNSFVFTALSCKGNNAVAAARGDGVYLGQTGFFLAFIISNDGGMTWRLEEEGLPASTWDHDPIIRKIDQIDSLHIFAFGDSDLLVRSIDGGMSWQQLSCPTKDSITDISFYDSLHGIMEADDAQGTYLTSNGGINWTAGPFSAAQGWQCHNYGTGKYRIFKSYTGVVYTTTNNWNKVDSTKPIIVDSAEQSLYSFAWCSFAGGDTLFAYGGHHPFNGGLFPAIAKSTDGGTNWSLVSDDTLLHDGGSTGVVYSLSDVSRDTIVAGLNFNINACIWSTDRGQTWNLDTLIVNDPTFPGIGTTFGVGLNSTDDLIAAISLSDGFAPAIIVGIRLTDAVHISMNTTTKFGLCPNPATNRISVEGMQGRDDSFSVLDPLGRAYSVPTTPQPPPWKGGGVTLDVSSLPAGIYFITDGSQSAKFVKE